MKNVKKVFTRQRKKKVDGTSADADDTPTSQVPHSLPTEAPAGYAPDFSQPPGLSQFPGVWRHEFTSYDITESQVVPTQAHATHARLTQFDPTLAGPTVTLYGSTQAPSDPSSFAGPSVQPEIMVYDPRSPFYIGEPGIWDDGRLIIYPEGDRGYCPSTEVTLVITKCIKSHWTQGWPTWGAVPRHVKEKIVESFEIKCKWHPALDYKIRSIFPKKCADLVKGAMYYARKNGQMPCWLYDNQWTGLQEYWQTPEFLKKSEQGKKARASEKGGSLHTGGSVSAATQKMRLEKKEKRAIPVTEMHKIRHIKKDKKSGEVWVEPRAKVRATQAVADWVSSQESVCRSNTPAPLTMHEETRIWLEVNGGVKKGSAYGLGILYASDKHPSNYMGATSSAPSSSANPEEMATIKEQLAVLTRQNEAQQKQMQEMMQMLLFRKDKSSKKSKGK